MKEIIHIPQGMNFDFSNGISSQGSQYVTPSMSNLKN